MVDRAAHRGVSAIGTGPRAAGRPSIQFIRSMPANAPISSATMSRANQLDGCPRKCSSASVRWRRPDFRERCGGGEPVGRGYVEADEPAERLHAGSGCRRESSRRGRTRRRPPRTIGRHPCGPRREVDQGKPEHQMRGPHRRDDCVSCARRNNQAHFLPLHRRTLTTGRHGRCARIVLGGPTGIPNRREEAASRCPRKDICNACHRRTKGPRQGSERHRRPQRRAQRKIATAAACFVRCGGGPHSWTARVFDFAQTPRATMSNLCNPGRLQCPSISQRPVQDPPAGITGRPGSLIPVFLHSVGSCAGSSYVLEKSALGNQHFNEASKTEFEPQIQAHAEDDDLPVEMAAFEKIINAQHPGQLHRGTILPPIMYCFHYLQQNQPQNSLHQNQRSGHCQTGSSSE